MIYTTSFAGGFQTGVSNQSKLRLKRARGKGGVDQLELSLKRGFDITERKSVNDRCGHGDDPLHASAQNSRVGSGGYPILLSPETAALGT